MRFRPVDEAPAPTCPRSAPTPMPDEVVPVAEVRAPPDAAPSANEQGMARTLARTGGSSGIRPSAHVDASPRSRRQRRRAPRPNLRSDGKPLWRRGDHEQLRPLRVKLSDPARVDELVAFLSRSGCLTELEDETTLLVSIPGSLHEDAARLEVDAYLRVWNILHPDAVATRVVR